MAVRQVQPHGHFPSGDRRALLEVALDPADLADRYGLSFEEELDDLDRYQRAAVALPDGSQAWLIKYRGEAGTGTTVYVDAAADPGETKRLLLRMLALAEKDLSWAGPVEVGAARRDVS